SRVTATPTKRACTLAATAVVLTVAVVGFVTTPQGTASRGSAAGGALRVSADPSGHLRFSTTKLSAKAGKITITLTNRSTVLHNMAVRRGPRCQSDTRCAGLSGLDIDSTDPFIRGSRTLTLNLKPGTYVFFCGVPGHEAGGMQGTLTVSP